MPNEGNAGPPPYIYPQVPREEVGPRDLYRNTHYDRCNGTTCPCYVEGLEDAKAADR